MNKIKYLLLNVNVHEYKFIFLLIIVHLVFFLYSILSNNYLLMSDAKEYYYLAENILHHSTSYCGDLNSTIYPDLFTRRPPLYSLFIILTSFFLKSKISILFFQAVLSIVSISIIKRIFEDYMGKPNSFFLYILVLSSVSQFIYANMIMSEIFIQFLIVMTILTFNKLLKQKNIKFLFYYQVLIILLLLTKPVFYLFVIPNIFLTYVICRRIRLKFGVLSSIIPIIIVLLYYQWNYERTGAYDFSSIQHFNLRDYNLRYFQTYKYGPAYAEKINDSIKNVTQRIQNYPDKIDFINSTTLNYLKKDATSYLVFHLFGSLKFFIDPGRYDLFRYLNLDSNKISEVGFLRHLNEGGIKGALEFLKSQPLIIIVLFNLILIINFFKLIGFLWFLIKHLKKSPLIYWIMLVFIVYIAGISGPVGAARFVISILPLYLFLSLYGLTDLFNITKNYWMRTSLTSPSS